MPCVSSELFNSALKTAGFGIKPTSSHATHNTHSSSELFNSPHPGATNFSLCICLVDIKLIGAEAPPPPHFGRSVLAGSPTSGRHVQPAIMPPLFPCHTHCSLGSFEGAAGVGRRLMQRGRGAAATQQGCERHLANLEMLLRFVKHHLELTSSR